MDEAEPIMAESDSWVIIGIFQTGGSTQDSDGAIVPDVVLRLHPGDQAYRLGYLLNSVGRHFGDDRVVHTDRPRRPASIGEIRARVKAKVKVLGPGKGKEKGHAQPKPCLGHGLGVSLCFGGFSMTVVCAGTVCLVGCYVHPGVFAGRPSLMKQRSFSEPAFLKLVGG